MLEVEVSYQILVTCHSRTTVIHVKTVSLHVVYPGISTRSHPSINSDYVTTDNHLVMFIVKVAIVNCLYYNYFTIYMYVKWYRRHTLILCLYKYFERCTLCLIPEKHQLFDEGLTCLKTLPPTCFHQFRKVQSYRACQSLPKVILLTTLKNSQVINHIPQKILMKFNLT